MLMWKDQTIYKIDENSGLFKFVNDLVPGAELYFNETSGDLIVYYKKLGGNVSGEGELKLLINVYMIQNGLLDYSKDLTAYLLWTIRL